MKIIKVTSATGRPLYLNVDLIVALVKGGYEREGHDIQTAGCVVVTVVDNYRIQEEPDDVQRQANA